MPVEIVLVRHGESEGNRAGVFTGHGPSRLTPLGRRQARATARALALHPVDAIYTSDLLRSVETAAPLAELTRVPAALEPALRERSVGDFTGLTFAEVKQRWPEKWEALISRDPDYSVPGGESHRACRLRVGTFLDEVLARHPGGRVVLYSHGVSINHLLRHVLDVDPSNARFYFQVENCSLQRFDRRDSGHFRIYAVNDTAHLVRLDEAGAD